MRKRGAGKREKGRERECRHVFLQFTHPNPLAQGWITADQRLLGGVEVVLLLSGWLAVWPQNADSRVKEQEDDSMPRSPSSCTLDTPPPNRGVWHTRAHSRPFNRTSICDQSSILATKPDASLSSRIRYLCSIDRPPFKADQSGQGPCHYKLHFPELYF